MKLQRNQAPSLRTPSKLVAIASGLAIAATGSGVPKANASTHEAPKPAISAKNTTPGYIIAQRKALTGIFANLEKGKSAKVTAQPIVVPHLPGNNYNLAQPLEFSEGGDNYVAYMLGHKPNFRMAPAQVVKHMLIEGIEGPGNGPALVEAHLDKDHVLIDNDGTPVGFTVGPGAPADTFTPAQI